MKNLKFSTKGRICFACLLEIYILIFFVSGRSVVWLARLLWEQEAESSNLSVPTIPTPLE